MCRVAWLMTCLPYPLDVALGNDGDVFDGTRSDEMNWCPIESLRRLIMNAGIDEASILTTALL